jgi:xanthine dehydrogenase accessory factor
VDVTAGGEHCDRTSFRCVELVGIEADALTGDIGENRQRIAELAGLEAVEECPHRIHPGSIIAVDPVLARAEEWRAAGEDVALATVVSTWRSAPRPVGSKLAVAADGRLFGSVSGGCVEADVAEHALTVLAGASPELVHYGVSDEQAMSVGLACGGEIDVFVERFSGTPEVRRGVSYVVVRGEGVGERWVDDEPRRSSELVEEGGRTVFAEAVVPPVRIVIVGAGDIAEALCAYARPLGWRTVVVDPRPGILTRERVPSADELVAGWPEDNEELFGDDCAVVALAHEERIDVPALRAGLQSGAWYVGALGSKRTQAKRRDALGDAAERIHGPIGLDLGAETPAEIALAIAAEILASAKKGEAPAGAPPKQAVESR